MFYIMINLKEQVLRVLLLNEDYNGVKHELKRFKNLSNDLFNEFINKQGMPNYIKILMIKKIDQSVILEMINKNINDIDKNFINELLKNPVSEEILERLIKNNMITNNNGHILSTNQKLSMQFIDKYKDSGIIDFFRLSQNKNTDLNIIDKYSDQNIDWGIVTMNIADKILLGSDDVFKFIIKYRDKLLTDILFAHPNTKDKLTQHILSYKCLNKDNSLIVEDLYNKLQNTNNMLKIYDNNYEWLINNLIIENRIDINIFYGGWNNASRAIVLHEYMIRKHRYEVNWDYIFKYQPYLSEEFKKEFSYKIMNKNGRV